ncbi:MAG: hypothetical protein OEU95_02145 [Nitrospirota bacterium]|nr:hypothetical protein [Nitrospirota bacterium]
MEKDIYEAESGEGILGMIWRKFGEVAKRLGLISDLDIEEALAKQQSGFANKRIGEILVENEKLTADHVEEVLKGQKEAAAASTEQVSPGIEKPVVIAGNISDLNSDVKAAPAKRSAARRSAAKKAVRTTTGRKKAGTTTKKTATGSAGKKAVKTTGRKKTAATTKKKATGSAGKKAVKTTGRKKAAAATTKKTAAKSTGKKAVKAATVKKKAGTAAKKTTVKKPSGSRKK